MKMSSAYSKKKRVKVETIGESRTQQHFEKEADVHNIIRKYNKTGLIANVNKGVAQYGDYSEINEYRENLDMVRQAQKNFALLPAKIRQKFGNDPGEFFEFANNPENVDEMVDLGLAEAAPPAVEETPVEPPASDG